MLASRAVRDLAARSGIDFDEVGRHALKGVVEEWDVYAGASTFLLGPQRRLKAPTGRRSDGDRQVEAAACGQMGEQPEICRVSSSRVRARCWGPRPTSLRWLGQLGALLPSFFGEA